jgi:transposase
VPGNITLVWLPPYSPQLNPVERLWLFLRERHLSHRLLDTYDAIVDALCRAWNALELCGNLGDGLKAAYRGG